MNSQSLPCFSGIDSLKMENRVKIGYCDDKFSRTKLDFAGNVQTGENNSVETTRLTRTETSHDFLVHGDLLRASLYGRQG